MNYQYYYTMEYLPTRYVANEREWENRHKVWNFKEGVCCSTILNDIVEIINGIVRGSETDYIICFIPASTKSKTNSRYSSLALKIKERTGVQTSLSAIIKNKDTESGYIAGKSSDPTTDFIFNSSLFRDKKVILIDDVITRGRTFTQTAEKLINNGATSVEGVFVAKTVNPDWNAIVA